MNKILNPLEFPEEFPALPKRGIFQRELLVWRYPSFQANSSWSIFTSTDKSGDYFVRRLEYDPRDQVRGANLPGPDIYGAESPLPSEAAEGILQAFEALRVPMFRRPPVSVALDGTQCGVVIGNDYQGTRVHWWTTRSEERAPLNLLFQRAIETLDSVLPASTLRSDFR